MELPDLLPGPVLEMVHPVHPVWRAGPAMLFRIPQARSTPTCWALRHDHGTWVYRLHPAHKVPASEVWQVHVGDALCTLCSPRLVGALTGGEERRVTWQAMNLLGLRATDGRPRLYWRRFMDFRSAPVEAGRMFGGGLVALGQARVNGRMVTLVTGDGPQAVEERALPPAWVLLQRLGMWWMGDSPDPTVG